MMNTDTIGPKTMEAIKRLNTTEKLAQIDAALRGVRPNYELPGYALAMRVMQSGLYAKLDDRERAECDALIAEGQGSIKPKRGGWVEYPHPLTVTGGFNEVLRTIQALIGSTQYEYKIENKVYIRRVQD